MKANEMTAGLRVTVEGLGTLTLVEPVGRCPHCPPPQVEQVRSVSGADAYEAQRERGKGRDANGDRMPIWELLDAATRAPWEAASVEVREMVEAPLRTQVRGGKRGIAMTALDPVERWSATNDAGELRIVDCRVCTVAP